VISRLARKWSPLLKAEGITMTIIDPGWSNSTELGDKITDYMTKYAPDRKPRQTDELAINCMKLLNGLTIEDSGAYYADNGDKLPF
jgi:hypothetical protein